MVKIKKEELTYLLNKKDELELVYIYTHTNREEVLGHMELPNEEENARLENYEEVNDDQCKRLQRIVQNYVTHNRGILKTSSIIQSLWFLGVTNEDILQYTDITKQDIYNVYREEIVKLEKLSDGLEKRGEKLWL